MTVSSISPIKGKGVGDAEEQMNLQQKEVAMVFSMCTSGGGEDL